MKDFSENEKIDFSDLERKEIKIRDRNEDWLEKGEEGELAVDVYQKGNNLIVKSIVAGVKLKDLKIYLHNDILTIKGKREKDEEVEKDQYFYEECFWGDFSRSIILPLEIQTSKVKAYLKNGILTIILPKAKRSKTLKIKIKEIEE